MAQEKDYRIDILSSLLTSSHGKLEELAKQHQVWQDADPYFYERLAAWYLDNGEVRDHKHLFATTLCLSAELESRSIGCLLLMQFAPFEVNRCVSLVKEVLHRNIPRSMAIAITNYLRKREQDPEGFERLVLFARNELKRLYAALHIKPSALAQSLLFEQATEGTLAGKLKELAKARSNETKRDLLLELLATGKLPFTVINSLIPKELWGYPEVARGLLQIMTPMQVLNHLSMLAARGKLQDDESIEILRKKMHQARNDKRVASLKAQRAIEALRKLGELGIADEWETALNELTQARLEKKGTITRSTAMLVDKSSSMEKAIQLARDIGATLAPLCKQSLHVVAFDGIPYPIAAPMTGDIGAWQHAFRRIKAGGITSLGSAIAWLNKQDTQVEQIVLISDAEENTKPSFFDEYKKYEARYGEVDLYWVQVGTTDKRTMSWWRLGTPCIKGQVTELDARKADYFSIPNLVSLLARPSWMDLVFEIASYPLPAEAPPIA
ncbi:MAG: VWA domain-containing protein [Myxococcales bacterium]|nr:VWA domain-containing protein [Myxococcales bacterium]MCB9644560.1 VWA domain-containing protein [Myxococcales bacterium]